MFKKILVLFFISFFFAQPLLGLAAPNRGYTGKELDPTGLNYYGQRYYNSNQGRFTQVDPVLRELHNDSYLKSKADLNLEDVLKNPQALNSYNYTANNPVKHIDPDGQTLKQVITGRQSLNDYHIEVGQTGEIAYNSNSTAKMIMDHPVGTGAVVGVVGGLLSFFVAPVVEQGLILAGGAITYFVNKLDGASRAVNFTSRYGKELGSMMEEVQGLYIKEGLNFDNHLVEQTVLRLNRGITPEKVIDVARNGIKYFDKVKLNYSYFKDGIRLAEEIGGILKTVVTEKSIDLNRFIKIN